MPTTFPNSLLKAGTGKLVETCARQTGLNGVPDDSFKSDSE